MEWRSKAVTHSAHCNPVVAVLTASLQILWEKLGAVTSDEGIQSCLISTLHHVRGITFVHAKTLRHFVLGILIRGPTPASPDAARNYVPIHICRIHSSVNMIHENQNEPQIEHRRSKSSSCTGPEHWAKHALGFCGAHALHRPGHIVERQDWSSDVKKELAKPCTVQRSPLQIEEARCPLPSTVRGHTDVQHAVLELALAPLELPSFILKCPPQRHTHETDQERVRESDANRGALQSPEPGIRSIIVQSALIQKRCSSGALSECPVHTLHHWRLLNPVGTDNVINQRPRIGRSDEVQNEGDQTNDAHERTQIGVLVQHVKHHVRRSAAGQLGQRGAEHLRVATVTRRTHPLDNSTNIGS
mmetsp:Transcript_59387/g.128021  ORF Transcript_59387/g.128021 Transcript_59387/m.128021 type:complete len:359 (-) Transcript_59387:1605-2681(-)